MRKSIWIAAAAAALVLAVLFWAFGGSSSKPEGTGAGESASSTASASHAAARTADELEWEHPAATAQELALPGGTPALKHPATEADGQLEIAVSARGKPVASARVRVYLRGPRDPSTGETPWRFAGGGATGSDGKLEVPARTGAYLIAARAGGFATARKEAMRAAGEKLTRVELSLEPGLSLRGRVVEKGTGGEVPAAQLTLTAVADNSPRRASAPAEEKTYATADPRGHFEIPNLARGSYALEARAPGRAMGSKLAVVPRSSELVVELGAASFIQGHVLASDGKAAAGAEVTITGRGDPEIVTAGQQGDFSAEVSAGVHRVYARSGSETGAVPEELSVAPGLTRDVVVHLGKPAAIAGVVRSKKTQAPLAGAVVGLSPYGENGDSGHATTGLDGHFSVEPLAPGAYDVVVAAEGHTDLSKRAITVAAGQRFSLTLELDGAGAVEGTVRDSTGAPIAGAVVQGRQGRDDPFAAGTEARTDAEGRYRIAGLDVGEVRLLAGRKPGVSLAWQAVDVREGETAHLDFTLLDSGLVQGRVTGPRGAPLDRAAEVRATPRENRTRLGDLQIGQVGADGRYRLELAAGPYTITAYYPGEGVRSFSNSGGVKVEPGAIANQDLEIAADDREAMLAGQVLEPDGSPSPSARVLIVGTDSPGHSELFADEAGHFEVARIAGPASSAYYLFAINGGRSGALQSVRSGTRDAVVPLQPSGSIVGHLAGAGAQVESYRLDLENLGRYPLPLAGSVQQFTGDTFELHEVPAIGIRVKVTASDGRIGSATTKVPSGGKAEVSVSLEAGVTVTGRALGPDRAPLAGATAAVSPSVSSPRSGSDGRFKLENVSGGTWMLRVGADWMRAPEQAITVTPGQHLDVGDVVLAPIRADSGTVGARFADEGSQVSIFQTLKEGPLDRAGVLRGDLLLAVDGQPVHTAQEATARTTGAPGSPVKLSIGRGAQRLDVEVLRAM